MELALTVEKMLRLLEMGGPWIVVFFIWWQGHKESQKWKEHFNQESHKWEKRFESVQRMYESNVILVKNYEKLANEQQELVIMNTNAISKLTTIIDERIKKE